MRLVPATILIGLVTACAVPHQRVTLVARGDVPEVDDRGGPLTSARHDELTRSLSLRIVATYRCAAAAAKDGVEDCHALPRKEPSLADDGTGVFETDKGGPTCVDRCTARVSLDAIVAYLGRPPGPQEIASQMESANTPSARTRENLRTAYFAAVQTRYRLYAERLTEQLGGAESVEITDEMGVGETRRYDSSKIREVLERSLLAVGDRYAAHEWSRFEARSGGTPEKAAHPAPRRPTPTREPVRSVPKATPAPLAAPESSPVPSGAPSSSSAPSLETIAPTPAPTGAPTASPGAVDAPYASPRPVSTVRESPVAPSAAPPTAAPTAAPRPAPSPDAATESVEPEPEPATLPLRATDASVDRCRRTCVLSHRTCLASCRDRPIEGGSYDACSFECAAKDSSCRTACVTPQP